VAKSRATQAKRSKKAAADSPKPRAAAAKADSIPPKPRSIPPKAASVRPPADSPSDVAEPASSVARWEERGEKDAYAFDLLERLVRYYGGRASATSSETMRSVAVVLSTLSLSLAASDDEQLAALARAAKDLRKHPA
jgi:hypothetical protein